MHAGYFFMHADFFQNHLFKYSFRIPSKSVSLDPDQAGHFVGPDLGLNCLQRLSVDNTSRQSQLRVIFSIGSRFPDSYLIKVNEF